MQLEESVLGDLLVLGVLEARIDVKNSGELKEAVGSRISEGQRRVLVDLHQVTYIDSTGLGALVSCLKLIGKEGEFALCGMNDAVTSLFKLTRMDRVFRLYTSRELALADLNREEAC